MYLRFCVISAAIELVLCQHHLADNRISANIWNFWKENSNSNSPNKYKLTGNTVCCCKSPQASERNNEYAILVVNNIEAINCTEKRYHDAICYCYLSLNSTSADAKKNPNDNSCRSSHIHIYIGLAAVILLIALLICIIWLLRKKTGFKVDEYCMVRPSNNRKSITIIRRSYNTYSDATFNNRKDDTITRIKYGSLRNNREYSHIYHSLDNVHMATEDSMAVNNVEKYRKYSLYRFPRKDSIQLVSVRPPLKDKNAAYDKPVNSYEHDIHRRRPFPLPHENAPRENNLSKSEMVSSTTPLPRPPKRNFRPQPRTPTSPCVHDTSSPLNSELIDLFKKRRQNENESMARPTFTPSSMTLPPPPPRQPNQLAHAPASRLDNNEDDDWTYEEFINVSIYNVK